MTKLKLIREGQIYI